MYAYYHQWPPLRDHFLADLLHMVNSPFTFWIDYNQGAFLEFHNTFGILSTHCTVWEFGRSKSFRMFVLAAILKNRKHRMYRPCWNPPFSYNCTAHAHLSSSQFTQFSVRKWYSISTNSNGHDAYAVIWGFATKHVVRVISWYKHNMSTEISVDSSHNRRTGQYRTWAYCFLPVFYRRWHPGCGGVTSD